MLRVRYEILKEVNTIRVGFGGHPTGVFLSSKIPSHSLFLSHSHSSHFNFQALQRFFFWAFCCVFVLVLIPSTSFYFL